MSHSAEDFEEILSDISPSDYEKLVTETEEAISNFKFIPNAGPQEEAYFSKADVLLFGGNPGGGKLLKLDTVIPVPLKTDESGFKAHGDLRKGDFVFAPDGTEVEVLQRHDTVFSVDAFELELNTGEIIVCDGGHLWKVMDRKNRDRCLRMSDEWRKKRRTNRPSRKKEFTQKPRVSEVITKLNKSRVHNILRSKSDVLSTRQMFSDFVMGDNRLKYSIDVISPIKGDDVALPVDPYLFGLWLGDGYTRNDDIVMMTSDWDDIQKYTPKPSRVLIEGAEKNRIQEVQIRRFEELRNRISRRSKKEIPPIYLRSSQEQRRELLRGMMDTDGTCDDRGHCELGFSNEKLARDALGLINSLGVKVVIKKKTFKKKELNDHWRMKFIPDFDVFKMKRKLEKQQKPRRSTVSRRYIKDIRPTKPTNMNCITVVGGLYCVGNTFITTHNSALLIGLASDRHHRSLIVRKNFSDLEGLLDNAKKILKIERGLVRGSRPKYQKPDGGVIHFAGLPEDGGVGGHQGVDHDLIGVDEAATIPRDQIKLIMAWLRTEIPSQRCRVVFASNPPLNSTGDWLITYFAPWLDDKHPNPAKPGELRYFLPSDDDGDVECGEHDTIILNGLVIKAQSRTYIPSKFTDNPYYDPTEYAKTLSMIPEKDRDILMTGNFMLNRSDQDMQAISTVSVKNSMRRWTEEGRTHPMDIMGCDVAAGGADGNTIARLHGIWFDEMLEKSGKKLPEPADVGGFIVTNRRNKALVVVDMGGGYGSAPKLVLNDVGIAIEGYKGVLGTIGKNKDKTLGFTNVRSEAYWKFHEALESDDLSERPILPDDHKLLAELTAPTYKTIRQDKKLCVQLEPKEAVKKKLGRSPDRADSVVMAWYYIDKAMRIKKLRSVGSKPVKAVLGYADRKKRRR